MMSFERSLQDCSTPFLQAGLAGLWKTLANMDRRGKPENVNWNLEKDRVRIEWQGETLEPLIQFVEHAWCVRDQILYCPPIHSGTGLTPERIHFHQGMMSTLLQHPTVQPRGEAQKKSITFDEATLVISCLTLEEHKLKYRTDAKNKLETVDSLSKIISLSGYVRPGSPQRFETEKTWEGNVIDAFLLWFAPLSIGFSQIKPGPGTWVMLIPDIDNIEQWFRHRRPPVQSIDLYSAGPGDAAFNFLLRHEDTGLRRRGCEVIVVGKVGWNTQQPVRKGVEHFAASDKLTELYGVVRECFPNELRRRKNDEGSHWVNVPWVAARITENIANHHRWYHHFGTPPTHLYESVEAERKGSKSGSLSATWFKHIRKYERKGLIKLMEHPKMLWEHQKEEYFVNTFHEALRALYGKEASAAEARGGAREPIERFADLNERIYRDVTRSKTKEQLRHTISDFWARSGRPPTLRAHTAVLWQFVNDDWEQVRDLALVALAGYKGKGEDATVSHDENTEENEA